MPLDRFDREMPVHERLLRRDMEPSPRYAIRGDHPDDSDFLLVEYDDGLTESVRKDAVWMVPRMALNHLDTRRQMREQGILVE